MSDNQSCPNYGSSLDYEEGKCNVCCFSLAPATGSAAGPNSHKCTTFDRLMCLVNPNSLLWKM